MLVHTIAALEAAIRATHECEAEYSHVSPVSEEFRGETAWEGLVFIFRLAGHPKAKRCYAWQYREGDKWKSVTVLEIPPVHDAQSAVKVAIAAKAREK